MTAPEDVLYLFDSGPRASIKNIQLCQWRSLLSQYDFDKQYRRSKQNVEIDAMSRVNAFCSQLDKTGYDAIDEENNKKYVAGDVKFTEIHTKWHILNSQNCCVYPSKHRCT